MLNGYVYVVCIVNLMLYFVCRVELSLLFVYSFLFVVFLLVPVLFACVLYDNDNDNLPLIWLRQTAGCGYGK